MDTRGRSAEFTTVEQETPQDRRRYLALSSNPPTNISRIPSRPSDRGHGTIRPSSKSRGSTARPRPLEDDTSPDRANGRQYGRSADPTRGLPPPRRPMPAAIGSPLGRDSTIDSALTSLLEAPSIDQVTTERRLRESITVVHPSSNPSTSALAPVKMKRSLSVSIKSMFSTMAAPKASEQRRTISVPIRAATGLADEKSARSLVRAHTVSVVTAGPDALHDDGHASRRYSQAPAHIAAAKRLRKISLSRFSSTRVKDRSSRHISIVSSTYAEQQVPYRRQVLEKQRALERLQVSERQQAIARQQEMDDQQAQQRQQALDRISDGIGMLDIAIPKAEMERYSVMFEKLLKSPTTTLAERRGTMTRLEPLREGTILTSSRLGHRRSATSPGYLPTQLAQPAQPAPPSPRTMRIVEKSIADTNQSHMEAAERLMRLRGRANTFPLSPGAADAKAHGLRGISTIQSTSKRDSRVRDMTSPAPSSPLPSEMSLPQTPRSSAEQEARDSADDAASTYLDPPSPKMIERRPKGPKRMDSLDVKDHSPPSKAPQHVASLSKNGSTARRNSIVRKPVQQQRQVYKINATPASRAKKASTVLSGDGLVRKSSVVEGRG